MIEIKTGILIIITFVFLLSVPLIYAPPPPDPESDFYYSDHVITGKITSSEIIIDSREDNSAATFYDTVLYQVQVTQWHKHPLDDDSITVYGTHYPNDVLPEPQWGVAEFEIGDMVYLYLDKTDGGFQFRSYGSYLIEPEPEQNESISEHCDPGTTFQDGICVVEEQTSNEISTGIWGTVIEFPSEMPPLKQFKSGVSIYEIQCDDSLVLVTKNDGSPACVKPSSVPDLIKRSWTTTEILLNMPLFKLGEECGHYSHNEFFDKMENYTLDVSCHDFVIQNALKDEKEMHEQDYTFDTTEQVWKKHGFPDVMMSISYHYMKGLELENENNISDQLRGVFGNCECQERIKKNPDNIERCVQPHISWENSTHYIDNNICAWMEK